MHIIIKVKQLIKHRGVEQLAARWAHNPKVGSSSLPPATKHKINTLHLAKYLFFLYGYKENIRFIKEKYKM